MKNTLALAIILLGGMLVYGGYKDYSFADTIRFFTGQKLQNPPPPSGTIPGTPTANPKDRPGYKDDQLQKNPDGSYKRDSNGYIELKPGATPFDPSQVQPEPK